MTKEEEQEMRKFLQESLDKNVRPVWRDLCQKLSDALVATYQIGFEEGMLKGYHQAGLIIEDTVIEEAHELAKSRKKAKKGVN